MNKRMLVSAATALTLLLAGGCSSDADVASDNLSKKAENFEILRRVVFYNSINGEYILEIKGFCSVEAEDKGAMTVTCKIITNGKEEFKKHFLGKADNVVWFAEQIEAKGVSTDRYEVNFKPSTIIPDVKAR